MNHQGKQRKGIGRQLGVAVLWWEDIDIASVITASGPTPTHMCRPHCGPGTPCDTHKHTHIVGQRHGTNIYKTTHVLQSPPIK